MKKVPKRKWKEASLDGEKSSAEPEKEPAVQGPLVSSSESPETVSVLANTERASARSITSSRLKSYMGSKKGRRAVKKSVV